MNTVKSIFVFSILLFAINAYSQIQLSEFTYENVPAQHPSGYLEYNNQILFRASTDGFGSEIWISDGTKANTTILKDINPGEANANPNLEGSAILNNELYFVAADSFSEGEIWKTNGTEEGTQKVTQFINGKISDLTKINNEIFFVIELGEKLLQVWKTNGTEGGSSLVKDSLSSWSLPSFTGKCKDTFIFTFEENTPNESRVWRSDGTSEGTFPLTEDLSGNGSNGSTSVLSQYIEFEDNLYFVTRNSLYKTDGTINGTNSIAELWQANSNLVFYSDVIEHENKMYFSFFSHESNMFEIWESTGTEESTSLIFSASNSNNFFPSNISSINEHLIFTSTNGNTGTSLFSLNTLNYEIDEIELLEEDTDFQGLFFHFLHPCRIRKISNNEYFLSTPLTDQFLTKRDGWILNTENNILNNIPELRGVLLSHTHQEILYYSQNNQFWKYDTSSNLNENLIYKPKNLFYPNPTSSTIQTNLDFQPFGFAL